MDSQHQNQNIEFRVQIEYFRSIFYLIMKIKNDNKYSITLIYKNEIENSFEFNFTDIQQNNEQFKTINDYFLFLNDFKNYEFLISDINKDYCELNLLFTYSRHILNNEYTFKLINKDKAKDIDSYKRKRLLHYNIDELIDMCKKNDLVILDDIFFERGKNCYIFKLNDSPFIIFFSEIKECGIIIRKGSRHCTAAIRGAVIYQQHFRIYISDACSYRREAFFNILFNVIYRYYYAQNRFSHVFAVLGHLIIIY